MNVPKPKVNGKPILACEGCFLALALAVVMAVGTFVVVIRPCTFVRGIYVGDGMSWEVVRWGFWGLEHGCFFGLRLLQVFDIEVLVDMARFEGLARFWVGCDCFDCETLRRGDGVFVRSGAFEGRGVMLGVSPGTWGRLGRRCFSGECWVLKWCCFSRMCWLLFDYGFSPRCC